MVHSSVVERSVNSVECCGFESHPRQLIFRRKSDCLGCAVLRYFFCLTLLASFFLPSHLSLKHVHIHTTREMQGICGASLREVAKTAVQLAGILKKLTLLD